MDKKLQKEILDFFIKNDDSYIFSKEQIIKYVSQLCFENFYKNGKGVPYSSLIEKQVQFLIDNKALSEVDSRLNYRITEWGELKAKGGIKQAWHWFIYRNHNLVAIMAVIVSITALLFSIF